MKIQLTIVLFFLTQLGIAQTNDLADFKIYDFCCYPPADTMVITNPDFKEAGPDAEKFENVYFDSGQLRIEFESITDTSAYMNEYYKSGHKRISCNVKIGASIDTTIRFMDGDKFIDADIANFGKEQIVIFRKWGYYPTGQYIEYQIPSKEKEVAIRSKGVYSKGKKVGKWEFYDRYKSENKYIINYNDHGELSGEYKAYYFNNLTGESKLKLSGSFAKRKYTEEVKTRSGKIIFKDIFEIRRDGEWKYYSRNGVLLEVVEYKWLQD